MENTIIDNLSFVPILEIYEANNGWIIAYRDEVGIAHDTCTMHEVIVNFLNMKGK